MSEIRSTPRRTIKNGAAVAMVLGLDLSKVSPEGFTLEPIGGDWLVRWEGVAVLDGGAAAILFGESKETRFTSRPEGRNPNA